MGDHDNGATVRLAATIARSRHEADGGTMLDGIHPDTIVEMALAAKREVGGLRAELAEAHREIARCHERLEITHTYDGLTGAVIPTPMEKRATAIDGIEARDCTIQLVEDALAAARAERDAAIARAEAAERERDEAAKGLRILRECTVAERDRIYGYEMAKLRAELTRRTVERDSHCEHANQESSRASDYAESNESLRTALTRAEATIAKLREAMQLGQESPRPPIDFDEPDDAARGGSDE